MLDAPVRIFRCPICVENHIKAPLQDLSVLIEHLAKHLNFYLFECRRCKDRFVTPFVANFHVKEGKCSTANGRDLGKGELLRSVNLNDVDFSSFCHLQNFVTKCTKQMLYEQDKRIKHCFRRCCERSKTEENCPSCSSTGSRSPNDEPPKKRLRLNEEFSGNTRKKSPESHESCTVANCQNPRAKLAEHLKQIFGVQPPRRDTRPFIFSNGRRYTKLGTSKSFSGFQSYGGGLIAFGEDDSRPNERKSSSSWFRDGKQASTSKLSPVSSMLWRDSMGQSP